MKIKKLTFLLVLTFLTEIFKSPAIQNGASPIIIIIIINNIIISSNYKIVMFSLLRS